MRILLRRFNQALLKRAEKQEENFRLFAIGACVFFLGLGMILLTEQAYTPSLQQELLALLGLLLVAIGAGCAALGYIGLSFLRILRAMQKHD